MTHTILRWFGIYITLVEPWAQLLRQRVFRKQKIIKHHIFSSIWSSIKSEIPTVENNTSCPLNNEVVDAAVIVDQTVSSIITDAKWDFSKAVSCIPTVIKERIFGCHIPSDLRPDSRVWVHSANGEFSSKIAYEFKRPKGMLKEWWQWLWSKSITPSKSCFVWKLLHNKLWNWLGLKLNFSYPILCWNDVWSLCNNFGAGQCKSVVGAVVIYVLNVTWLARNKIRFHNAKMNFSAATSYIMEVVSLAGSVSSVTKNSNMQDFIILKSFKVTIRPPKAPVIIEVIWKPPPRN
ncbi:uncharacterized protein LOC131636708 [Vicia villosa]|uniref:uncharacterized protein LOC131636708 n=1 Tax=Vicia villosa TaxID=3911 RepID=UPI00273A7AB9|nr:uncharacterized protein LOC131636708 [Vicia villosa]